MIVYFTDREMNIIGQASTGLPKGLMISDDKKTEEIKNGSKTFEFNLNYIDRAEGENITKPGNYLLRASGDEYEFYTIIDAELDLAARCVNVYAEEAGLDLLNELAEPYSASSAMTAAEYFALFASDSGFEIRVNEISDLTRTLEWTAETTVLERLQSVASQFGAELSFSFEIDKLSITHKYVNFWKKRGRDTGVMMRMGQQLGNIRIKRTVANLATALLVRGGTPSGSSTPITLSGYSYDDTDIYVDGQLLRSRTALAEWSRFLSPTEQGSGTGDIVKMWTYDTTSQAELCTRAVTHLKSISHLETTYTADVVDLPKNVRIGDTVLIADEEGQQYIKARIMKMITCVGAGTRDITLTAI